MASCKCFRCGKGYDSLNEDDIAGDGRCAECKEVAKKIALKVDIEIGNSRRKNRDKSRIRQLFTEDQIRDGFQVDLQGRILGGVQSRPVRLADLGITPND